MTIKKPSPPTLEARLSSVFALPDSAVFTAISELPKQPKAEMPLQAGLWIADMFSEQGSSGSAVVKIKQDILFVHAPEPWNTLTTLPERRALFGIPFSPAEQKAHQLPKENNGVAIVVFFEKFVFNEKGVRYAQFKIAKVHEDEKELWCKTVNALGARHALHKIHPFDEILGVS